MPQSDSSSSPSIEAAAAQWLARRDRGLSASEQDAYLEWLRQHPAHAPAVARLEQSWTRLDALRSRQPSPAATPDPDLLAPRRPKRLWMWPAILAVAATITIGALLVLPRFEHRPRPEAVLKLGPQRVALEDGSLMELNAHALAELRFTPGDRHVRLLQGEAHFVVAHDPVRPFVVTAESFSVRALGTAFALRFDHESLSVLVTEGRIQLDETRSATATLQNRHELSRVAAGQKATVRTGGAEGVAPALTLQELSSAEIDQALAWQTLRLEFNDLPLRDVVAEFNRFNHRKLVIGDRATGDILVGGSFRPDRIESFVRVLELGFGVKPELREHEILLSRGP